MLAAFLRLCAAFCEELYFEFEGMCAFSYFDGLGGVDGGCRGAGHGDSEAYIVAVALP